MGIAFDNQKHLDIATWKNMCFLDLWIEGESKIYQPQQLITNHEQEQKITTHDGGW